MPPSGAAGESVGRPTVDDEKLVNFARTHRTTNRTPQQAANMPPRKPRHISEEAQRLFPIWVGSYLIGIKRRVTRSNILTNGTFLSPQLGDNKNVGSPSPASRYPERATRPCRRRAAAPPPAAAEAEARPAQ